MSSNYAAFAIWSISALLAGLYFPLDDTTKALKTLSYLMPQRWFMDASELLLVGDKSAYSMILCVTVAYDIVNITLHFFLKDVRSMLPPAVNHSISVS